MGPQTLEHPWREGPHERIIHDLHGPLTVIRGLCATLCRDEADPARRRRLELIDGEVERLAGGLDRLRGADRRGLDPATTCLTALAVRTVERHAGAAEAAGVRLRAVARAATRAVVAAPAEDLGRVVDNLLRNAIRHAGAGGGVRLGVRASGGSAHLWVRDDGPGVPAADRERIFTAGERGSRPLGAGRGMGLAIAREIVERHGGRLTLDPLGPGATLRIVLPRVAGSADRTAA